MPATDLRLTEEETRRLWAEAQTFDDLRALMRRFLTAELPLSPIQTISIDDPGTRAIIPQLVALNDAGLLTIFSQTGLPEGAMDGQRACVEGFATEATALGFAEKALYTDLHIQVFPPQVFPPGERAGYMVPITRADGHPFTWIGRIDADRLQGFDSICGDTALAELESAWYVVAIDLKWGRFDHLWKVLLAPREEGFSTRPHPDSGSDLPFVC